VRDLRERLMLNWTQHERNTLIRLSKAERGDLPAIAELAAEMDRFYEVGEVAQVVVPGGGRVQGHA
jgi:hypothetical protein